MSRGRTCDILLICFPGAETLSGWLEGLLRAMGDRLAVSRVDAAGAAETIPDSRMAWVVSPADQRGEDFYELLDRLCQWDRPTLLSLSGEHRAAGTAYQPGVVLAPPDAGEATLEAMVRATLAQSESLVQLRHELMVTRRHHGGLRWQMDKLDEELRLAAQVQREFLPRELPNVEGLDLGVIFRPTGYVGGDVYDVQRLDEQHIGLWIADVVGHGVPAALMTMFVKAALPTKEISHRSYRIVPPSEALARLNAEMVGRELGAKWFVTACYALVNCRTLDVQIASAGHPPAMLVHADGTSEMLAADGPLLGVFENEPFTPLNTKVKAGDRLILHSDGFETAFSDGERHDTERYRDELVKLPMASASDAVSALIRVIEDAPGSLHQTDDVTAIIADVTAHATAERAAKQLAGTSAI